MLTSTGCDADRSADFVDRVRAATSHRTPLRIVGGDTKRFYGRQVEGERLDVSGHRGVLSYDPSELVITARAGTPIVEIEALLAEHGQRLGFEPPIFGEASTVGGVVAAGLSGPRRPFAGAVRDFVLGVTLLNGRSEALRLGGTVFKNVAGFDGFRLMAGALGCLGVLLDISLRVLPMPVSETTLAVTEDWPAARARLLPLMGRQSGLSGAIHDGERLHLRLSGSSSGVAAVVRDAGGMLTDPKVWQGWRNLNAGVAAAERLWRLAVPPRAPLPDLPGERLTDWAGAQIWQTTSAPADRVRAACAAVGGHATLFRGAKAGEAVFAPLAPPVLALHKRLKLAFDPAGIFNPGRMYEDL